MPYKPRTHKEKRTAKLHRKDGFYSLARWRKLRSNFLARNPLCADPFGIHKERKEVVAAWHVDHVIPRSARPDLEYDWKNLQGLCVSCHSKKTAREQG